MKKITIATLSILVALASCSDAKEESKEEDLIEKSEQFAEDNAAVDETALAIEAGEIEIKAINLWPKLGIYQVKDGELKWVKSEANAIRIAVVLDHLVIVVKGFIFSIFR